MRINRVFVEQPLIVGQALQLERSASQHLIKVLRLKVDALIELFNGDGNSYPCKLIAIERNNAVVHILDSQQVSTESPLKLHLFQGVSRGDKMDFTLQKGVELGISHFTPIITERCGVKLDEKRWQKKHQHWSKVITSACEQSRRNVIPKLDQAQEWQQAVSRFKQPSYFLHPQAKLGFKQLTTPKTEQIIQLWVGPEGGFSDNEILQIEQSSGQPVSLGPRVLRTETAALAAVSAINTLWGDF